jgi:bacterioferritin
MAKRRTTRRPAAKAKRKPVRKSAAKAAGGPSKIIRTLDEVKAAEITAILQFMAHRTALENLGFEGLAKMYQAEAVEEMGHDHRLADRIYFLGGVPSAMPLVPPKVGQELMDILANDIAMEKGQIDRVRAAIKVCQTEGDPGSRHILDEILADEEHHWDELTTLRDNIGKYGIPYLTYAGLGGEAEASEG